MLSSDDMLSSIHVITGPPDSCFCEPAVLCVSHNIGPVTRIGLLFCNSPHRHHGPMNFLLVPVKKNQFTGRLFLFCFFLTANQDGENGQVERHTRAI